VWGYEVGEREEWFVYEGGNVGGPVSIAWSWFIPFSLVAILYPFPRRFRRSIWHGLEGP